MDCSGRRRVRPLGSLLLRPEEAAPSQRQTGPDQQRDAGRRNAGDGLTDNPEHRARVREPQPEADAGSPAVRLAGGPRGERAARLIERQVGPLRRLPSGTVIDLHGQGGVISIGNPKCQPAPPGRFRGGTIQERLVADPLHGGRRRLTTADRRGGGSTPPDWRLFTNRDMNQVAYPAIRDHRAAEDDDRTCQISQAADRRAPSLGSLCDPLEERSEVAPGCPCGRFLAATVETESQSHHVDALGGLRPADGPALRVDVLDTATGAWSAGPDLPEAGRLQGFGVAATSHDGRIFISQADGKVYRLADSGNAWKQAATLEHPRFMHRLVPFDGYLLGVGGSARGGHLTAIDVVRPAAGEDDAGDRSGASRWPGFRGGADTNVSRAARLPLTWSDESVAWRAKTPGFGQSSPVIWDGIVFLTSIEGAMKETLWVSAVSLDDGSERWRRSFEASERLEWNDYVSKGAPTPAVDADRLYAFFASGDLLALTHDGDTVWHRNLSGDYGSVGGNHGVGSSVLLTDRAVVVLLTRRTYSYLLAVAPDTGDTLWKADREAGVAWSTPVLTPDGDEIVVSAAGRIEGFDPDTGTLRWSFTDLEGNYVASPTITDDLVIVGGLRVAANLALHRPEAGALEGDAVAWTAGSASNFGSPFAYRDCVYWVNPAGAARCLAPDSGTVQWTHRLPASTWATPLGHDNLVYFFTTKGITQVLRASAAAPEVVATNHLSVDAPVTGFAAVDDAIVIRAGDDVIRVGGAAD